MATNESLKKDLQKRSTASVTPKGKTTMQDWVKAYEGQIAKALPSILTPERFSRMVLTALTQTPKLAECTPQSFIGAMLNAAQLGLEPNTPLGQAYLIPYGGVCQFQIGYKGLLDLAYRSGEIECIDAEIVYNNDTFEFEYGLHADLVHKPAMKDRGEMKWVYAYYKLKNGGYSFKVMPVDDVIKYAKKYSKSFKNGPWQTDFEAMAKKTVLKQLLKYAPLKSEFAKAVNTDEKANNIEFGGGNEAPAIVPQYVEADGQVVEDEGTDAAVDSSTGEVIDYTGTPFEGMED